VNTTGTEVLLADSKTRTSKVARNVEHLLSQYLIASGAISQLSACDVQRSTEGQASPAWAMGEKGCEEGETQILVGCQSRK
jgi:hypothetical protein